MNSENRIREMVAKHNLGSVDKLLLITVPAEPETVRQMADRLEAGQSVICRSGARGQLVGLLKARCIFASSKVQPDGQYLFYPTQPRKFK